MDITVGYRHISPEKDELQDDPELAGEFFYSVVSIMATLLDSLMQALITLLPTIGQF